VGVTVQTSDNPKGDGGIQALLAQASVGSKVSAFSGGGGGDGGQAVNTIIIAAATSISTRLAALLDLVILLPSSPWRLERIVTSGKKALQIQDF